jgi:hypothetical protein
MPKDEQCCDICALIDKYVNYIKVCETDEELEFNVRKAIETAHDIGFKDCLRQNIKFNLEFLDALEADDEFEEEKPNLRVVDNIKPH